MIENIKPIFPTEKLYKIYSLCMHLPTYEKFITIAKDYVENANINIYAFYSDGTLSGTIVIRKFDDNKAEIVGIAVKQIYQNKHIGRQLIEYSVNNGNFLELFTETDNEAVLFYEKCGFEIEGFYKTYGKTQCKRYKCRYYNKLS